MKLVERRSQQTAVMLLDLPDNYKTSKEFLFSWFLKTWEIFSACSSSLWLSPTDKFYPARTVGFKS